MSFKDMNLHNFRVSADNLLTSAFGIVSDHAADDITNDELESVFTALTELFDYRTDDYGLLQHLMAGLAIALLTGDKEEARGSADLLRRELDFMLGDEKAA